MKLKGIIAIISVVVFACILLPGCGDGGVPTITTPSVVQTARLSGTVYVPTGVSGARMAGRVASVVGQDTPLTGATVTVKRMKSDGTLESIGTDYSATTDANGQYTIEDVPLEENLIIEATKDVSVNGNPKTLKLKKVTSVTEADATAGAVSNLNLDVATTLGAEAMKDIVVTANQGVADADQITGADLPRETIADIESGIVTALVADQSSGSPAVNLSTVVTDGDTAADAQLTSLEDSASGTTVKNLKSNASTKGSLRVVVTITGGSVALEGATVIVTNDGNVQTKSTDANGEAFFDGITAGTTLAVEVKKEGYVLGKASKKIEKAAVVHVAKIEMTATLTNQAPVAKAGPDQSVLQHATVTLDGSSSFDPDGTSITYSWTQTSGTAVSLSSSTAAQPTFTAAADGVLVFALTVRDGSLTSEVDTVTITVGAVACMTDADCDDSSSLTIDACTNAGTTSSVCGHTAIACAADSDCNDNNEATYDQCNNGGTAGASCGHTDIILNEWITIPAGDFVMGCADTDTHCIPEFEKPKHTVNLSEYKIQKYEVTNVQYMQCVDAGICKAPVQTSNDFGPYPYYYGESAKYNYPVTNIDWTQANTYCVWIGGRLPTEAEWEKAARGPSPREVIYPWGNTNSSCNYSSINCNSDIANVGSYPSGASYYGVMDLVGNTLVEWVNDWWQEDYYSTSQVNNPQGPTSGIGRVMRGGDFVYVDTNIFRVSARMYNDTTYMDFRLGFRCAHD